MINEVAIVMTFPSLLHLGGGGGGDTSEKLPFTALPLTIVHGGLAVITCQVLRMDRVDFFIPNTFQSGE